MCSSIREFGFKIPVLARSDGEVVDGHLRLKAARKLGSWPGGDVSAIPVILCDEWTLAQVKAFRLLVNRSVTWAEWDEELLALELQELNAADFDLRLTGFDPKEIDDLLLADADDDRANAVPPVPEIRCRARAICGSAARTACCAGIRPARRPWHGCWASASRCCWSARRICVQPHALIARPGRLRARPEGIHWAI